MKTFIFSDTHLTTNFNQKLFNFLKKNISESDQVIINGDFWDGMSISFDEFLHSEWKKIFPLLKAKKTIYLYGNHDRESYCDKRVILFSNIQANTYDLKTPTLKLHLQHGHEIVPFNDKEVPNPLIYKRGNDMYLLFETLVNHISLGTFFHIYRVLFSHKMRKYSLEKLKENEILVTGHIHAPEYDLKNRYINLFTRHHIVYYLIVNEDKLEFKKEKI